MDCEKFEPLLLDELYEELDELTRAALRRHVAGCTRCAQALDDMKETRRAAALPIVAVPAGLEERILAAAKEAQKVVPIRSRLSRALSAAGSWAMRPQTAMAAVFLLMIGTSAFVIRSKGHSSSDGTVSVTVQGEPAPMMEPTAMQNESLDDKAAAAAHGPIPPAPKPVPTAPPAGSVFAAVGPEGESAAALEHSQGYAARKDEGGGAYALDASRSRRAAPAAIANAAPPAGAPSPTATATPSKAASDSAQDPFSLGAAAFRARNFPEATRQFDIAAQGGDSNAALWAAQSVREGSGCAAALGRYDALARRSPTSWAGAEASLRAARCQMDMGHLDAARERLNKVAQVTSHKQPAEEALAELDRIAQRKATATGAGAVGGAVAAPRAAPARSPEASPQKKAVDVDKDH